ncbi:cytochrome C oxidase subunit IV family protein [Conexibacter sp. W3-3-2]|uniref:cytochrome C oxidase subunit IV family protein n=1 Tax=Conexibacter sp. W3-3-2 TaxID=2675227 RepID=UPI001E2827AA|nr:cytochrome C oxidase subunit IV family protein [Conexibacter sp. W3-3-2]
MSSAITRPLAIVWVVLVASTAVSWLVGDDHGFGSGDAAAFTVIAIAFAKVWLVGLHFMELRHAPPRLRRLFEAWVVVVPVVLAAMYAAG